MRLCIFKLIQSEIPLFSFCFTSESSVAFKITNGEDERGVACTYFQGEGREKETGEKLPCGRCFSRYSEVDNGFITRVLQLLSCAGLLFLRAAGHSEAPFAWGTARGTQAGRGARTGAP